MMMGFADWFAVLRSLLNNVSDFVVVKQGSKTQNGTLHSESEKEVGKDRRNSNDGEESKTGHLIISLEAVAGEERVATDEVVENVEKDKIEGGEPDSMSDTMASLSLSHS